MQPPEEGAGEAAFQYHPVEGKGGDILGQALGSQQRGASYMVDEHVCHCKEGSPYSIRGLRDDVHLSDS
jgi:hypothetical protein